MHVDKVDIHVKGGHGGSGSASFRREKFVAKGGPDGGDGGNGGNIVIRATKQKQTLMDLKLKKSYSAKGGQSGRNKKQFGAAGADVVIEVPLGTVIMTEDGDVLGDLTSQQEEFIAAKGGKGGKGNVNFASSVNRAPTYAQPGLPGEERSLILELKMIAQVGIIGLPNAGKSTLLHALTMAKPKIASYPFTTLYPNLGVLKHVDREIVLADIPGLIEGAAEGHGLGHDFLRHVERTSILLHLVAPHPDGADATWADYCAINSELEKGDVNTADKVMITALSKIDTIDEESSEEIASHFKENGIEMLSFSSHSHQGLDELVDVLFRQNYD